ncbi:MAG: hypothetical protein ACFFD4_00785 [Candidatus Odinarchaeota archaeon]
MIDQMREKAVKTLIKLENSTEISPEMVQLQKEFSGSVQKAWEAYKSGRVEVEVVALPRVMYTFAVEELPLMISEESCDVVKIKNQLKLFLNTLDHVVNPEIKER